MDLDRASAETLLVSYDQLGAAGLPISFASVPLLALGLLIMAVALVVRRDGPRVAGLLLLVGVVLISGTLATLLAARAAIRQPLLDALRSE